MPLLTTRSPLLPSQVKSVGTVSLKVKANSMSLLLPLIGLIVSVRAMELIVGAVRSTLRSSLASPLATGVVLPPRPQLPYWSAYVLLKTVTDALVAVVGLAGTVKVAV